MPLRLPALISRAEFVEEVGNREGAYQLQPIDGQAQPIGDPPSMVFLPARPAATPPALAPKPEPTVEPAMVAPESTMVAPESDGAAAVVTLD